MGLSTFQISPRHVLTTWTGGDLVELRREEDGYTRRCPGKRTRCRGFSASSRRNMQRQMARINGKAVPGLPLEAGLTYHYMPAGGAKQWKRDLDLLCRRILRQYPRAFVFWRLEFQSAPKDVVGVPHFHLLIFGPDRIPHEQFRNWWYEIAGQSEAHRRAGTHIERVRNRFHTRAYVSKYMAKETNLDVTVGRWWGIAGRVNYDRATQPVEEALSPRVWYRFRRVLAGYVRAEQRSAGKPATYRTRSRNGCTVFLRGDVARRLVEDLLRVERGGGAGEARWGCRLRRLP